MEVNWFNFKSGIRSSGASAFQCIERVNPGSSKVLPLAENDSDPISKLRVVTWNLQSGETWTEMREKLYQLNLNLTSDQIPFQGNV